MELKLNIDRTGDIPVYKQIIEGITAQVQCGRLKAGDRLPAERELASELDIARGTVKKAYEELERNRVIDALQGSGSFVSAGQDIVQQSGKQRAISLVDGMLTDLEGLGFSHREIGTLVNLRIMERDKNRSVIRIAGVDCNPEALSIFESQLSYISNVTFSKFLLDDILEDPNTQETLEGYDLIVTTSTHYEQLQSLLPGVRNRIIRAAVSPSRQTVIDLASVPEGAAVGIVCVSRRFLEIIKNSLRSFDIRMKDVAFLPMGAKADYSSFANEKSVLIIPPDFEGMGGERCREALEGFGGKVVRFDYQIERGSLFYIEEQIAKAVKNR